MTLRRESTARVVLIVHWPSTTLIQEAQQWQPYSLGTPVSDYRGVEKGLRRLRRDAKGHAGVTSDGVYQADDNANDVTIYHEFATMDAAKKFAGSDELKTAMQSRRAWPAHPTIWFANRV